MGMIWRKVKNIYHLLTALLANAVFLFPAKRMQIVAVTGTDGKTTTVNLIYHILRESGHKASMISSIGAMIDGKPYDTGAHVTTPPSFSLQKFLKKANSVGSEYFILEVTSHAIDQKRIFGVPIKVGVLTNITEEHLDYHKTYNKYLCTKLKLLEAAEIAIVNKDDRSYPLLIQNRKNNKKWKTYGFSQDSDYSPRVLDLDTKDCKLLSDFNKYNVLAAVAVVKELGTKEEAIRQALRSFKMPIGREEYVYKKDFSVMIDFAHTPNAFKQLLGSLRKKTKGRIIHIFGSAGERDKEKRPIMGKVSSDYADLIILTAEDPREEQPC